MPEKKDKKKLELLVEINEIEFERGIITALREVEDQKRQLLNVIEDVYYYKKRGYDVSFYYNKKTNELSYQIDKPKKNKIGYL
jgi:hypothetical protein